MSWAEKKYASINGLKIAYVEKGVMDGDPIVFIHGNPTSSYLWRNVIPSVTHLGRCIAPDLVGMGDSDKIMQSGPESYTFVEHRDYLFSLLDELGIVNEVTLVVHDWGSALGFDWANQHRERVKGIVYMEAIVKSLVWEEWPERARPAFQALRSSAGEKMILEDNFFVERMLPGSILRDLTEEEMSEYRRPFLESGEMRRPTLTWPRQIPIEGEPDDVTNIVNNYSDWLVQSDVPKLFIDAKPGAILTGTSRDYCRTWKNQTEVTVKGSHFIQEDSPEDIGKAISEWLEKLN